MKKLLGKQYAYENLLIAYYSDDKAVNFLYNNHLRTIVNKFLEIYANEDGQKGTNHLELVKAIYANPEIENRVEFFKSFNISNSTLWRYREKYCITLKMVIDRFVNTELDETKSLTNSLN